MKYKFLRGGGGGLKRRSRGLQKCRAVEKDAKQINDRDVCLRGRECFCIGYLPLYRTEHVAINFHQSFRSTDILVNFDMIIICFHLACSDVS